MNEFSRIIDFSQPLAKELSITATPTELDELKKRFGFNSIFYLSAQIKITENKKIPCFMLDSIIKSSVNDIIIEEILKTYIIRSENDLELFEITDDVEIMNNNKIDIGEIIAQHLYLAANDKFS